MQPLLPDRTRTMPDAWLHAVARRCTAVIAAILSIGLASDAYAAGNAKISPAALVGRPPVGFETLMRPQKTLVDIYFGGRRVGDAMAIFEPGSLRFGDPAAVAALIPRLRHPATITRVLATSLPTHPELVCVNGQPANCGRLSPAVAGIIFDEDRFRAEIFVNPAELASTAATKRKYLPAPAAGLSLADTIGGALSGSDGSAAAYSIQNRAVLGFHEARLTTEFSQSSDIGLQVDTLSGAIDRPGIRYQAGLLWTPALDFTGQSRIYGAGVGSQVDTRADREQIGGTPLLLFLPRRSQVDIFRNGRLLASKLYDAGNQILDTQALPDGAYTVTLRIHEIGGTTREVQQFFVKSRSLPPPDAPTWFFDAGVLANTGIDPLPNADAAFAEAGGAIRLSSDTAIDATTLLFGKTFQTEMGGTYFTEPLRLHAAVFGDTGGNYGMLLDSSVTAFSTLSLNVDLRKTWGPGQTFVSPASAAANAFTPIDRTGANQLTGNSLQISGSLSYSIGTAQFGLTGTYLETPLAPPSYSVGPTLNWTFRNDGETSETLVAGVTKSSDAFQAGISLRIQFNQGNASLVGEAGGEALEESGRNRQLGTIGSLTGTYVEPDVLASDLTGSVGIAHKLDNDVATIGGQLRGAYGVYTAEADQTFNGVGRGSQYSVNFVTSSVADKNGIAIGGQDTSESGIIVRLAGNAPGTLADVLIDGSPRGRIETGQSLPILLTPYRAYAVRLAPVGAPPVAFDTSEQTVSLFPGNVETLEWHVEPVFGAFGRALNAAGQPIANARIDGAREPAMTDAQGYFQVALSGATTLTLHAANGGRCMIRLPNVSAKNGYAALGRLICRDEHTDAQADGYRRAARAQ